MFDFRVKPVKDEIIRYGCGLVCVATTKYELACFRQVRTIRANEDVQFEGHAVAHMRPYDLEMS
jgi:hypothetical protein